MKNLVLGSLIAIAATQAAGCVIESDSTETATVSATWSFRNEASGTATGCPAGYDTVALYNKAVDGDVCDDAGHNPCIDLFPCSDMAGVSAPLRPTVYTTWIAVTDSTNTNQYAQSTEATVDTTVSDKTFSAQILNDGGYFLFGWNIVAASNNAALSCADDPGGVSIVATDVAQSSYFHDDDFDCEDGSDYTAGYRAGTYTVSVAALDSQNNPIGMAPTLTNKVIGTQNAITNLGTINIPIDGR